MKPKYKIVVNQWSDDRQRWSAAGDNFVIYKLIFNWFYIPWGTYTDRSHAEVIFNRLMGFKVCMMCKTKMEKDQFGEYCPNEDCIYMDIPQRTHFK